jgi:SAM-dependent methyltransferase
VMDIVPYYRETIEDNLLPQPLRCLIVGSSGCGKTNLLLNFIYNRNGLLFRNLYVFSKSIEQPAYAELREKYVDAEKKLNRTIAYFFSNCDDLPPLDGCKKDSLVVFDDCLMENQDVIKDYFIRGRHRKLSCVYLSQSYGRVDMQVIRNNVNLLCVFRQNKYYTKRIYDDFVGADMSFGEFEKMCEKCWSESYGFLTINMNKKPHNGKYMFKLKDVLVIG